MVWKGFASHPVVPMLLGVLLTWDTAGNLSVKSYTLALLCLWLWIDIAIWALKKRMLLRFALCGGGCSAAAIALMVSMHYLLSEKLREQEDDVSKNLKVAMFFSEQHGAELNVVITNGGSTNIGKHRIVCIPNVLAMKEGGGIDTKNGQNGSGIYGFVYDHPESVVKKDSETDTCFPSTQFRFTSPLECGDVTIELEYVLDTQPDLHNKRRFRFVTRTMGGNSYWAQQPINFIDTTCVIHSHVKPTSR